MSEPSEAAIREAMRGVIDPELRRDVVELGMLGPIAISGSDVTIACISAGSSAWSTMSIFSPCSSAITARTRPPIGPMHAPLAFTPATVARTAILVR